MPPCPEPERLAAYLDGQLFPEQRERLEEHFARCGRCANALADSVRFQTRFGPPAREGMRTRWAAAAAVVLVAAPTALWVATRADGPPWRSNPRAPLIAATAEERPLVPRLTGGFHWAPPRETLRSASAAPASETSWATYAAADLVRRQTSTTPSPDRLGALADAHLLAGDLDRALVTLARATAADPDDLRLRSDLAAAYLARGQRLGTAADLAAAVETASEVRAAEPSLVEAQFNLALALEGLQLRGEARSAWNAYLAAETDPQWTAEAERHLRELHETTAPRAFSTAALRSAAQPGDGALPALVAAHRFQARRLVEWELLPEWGTAVEAGDGAAAKRALDSAAAIARLYAEQTGEGRLAKQVAEARAASGPAARRLAAAHRALGRGEAAIERMDSAVALAELARAAASFPLSSIGSRRASLELLIAQFTAQGLAGGLPSRVEQRAALGGDDIATRARLEWLRGVIAGNQAKPGQAIGLYLSALAAFERLGEAEPAAWMHSLLSEAYTLAGDERGSWQHRAAAVAAASTIDDPRRSFGILLGAASWSLLSGHPWLAESFLDELKTRGYASQPYEQAYVLLWRARVRLELGDRPLATSELAEMALATRTLPPSGVRDWLTAELAATRGITAGSSERAVTAISQALATFRARQTAPRLPGLLLQRSLAYREVGDAAAAERDLREGIALLEQQPRLGLDDEVWLTRLDGADALFDQMVAIELGRARPDQAFMWSERARRRALAAYAGNAQRLEPLSPERVGRELEAGTTLLSFALVGDQALLWRVDGSGSRLIPLRASSHQISSWVGMLDADLAAGEWTRHSEEVAKQLHAALIAPAALARGTSRLIIVADKSLTTLPFAALVDHAGAFLVQRYTIEMAPSAAFYLHARDRWQSLAGEQPSALVLGDPRVDEQLFPGLPPLPGAADEARRIAALYPGSILMTRERATRDALTAGLAGHAIVHLATHALVDEASPSRSALALAARRPGDGTGVLFADEISTLALARTRTVVLASCGGTAGPLAPWDGRMSLPRAFLSADVPTVVAALWPIGDRRSVELLTGLHGRLRAGDDPASALRGAQLRLLASSDRRLRSPATWALFQVLGG